MSVTLNYTKNFQEYTIVAAPSTTLAAGIDVAVVEAITTFPTLFPVTILAYDPTNELATRELIEVSSANVSLRTMRWNLRGQGGTVAVDHINGQKIRIVMTSEIIEQIRTALLAHDAAIITLQGQVPGPVAMTGGAVISATTTANGITGPTACYKLPGDGRLYPLTSVVSPQQLMDDVYFAAGACAGAGSSISVYLPGQIIPGWTGLSMLVQAYYPDPTTPGGLTTAVGNYWKQLIEPLSTTVARFKESGRNSQNHTTVGTTGTAATNNGVASTLARSDHEHSVINHIPWSTIDPPTTGDKQVPIIQRWGYDVLVTGFEFSTITAGSTTTIGDVQWKTKANYYANTGSWVSIFNGAQASLASGVRGVSSNSTSFTGVLPTWTWSADIVLKFEITTLGTGVGRCAMQLTVKAKNTL